MIDMDLDAYIARFQNMPSWNIHIITEEGKKSLPWYEVGPEIYRDLVLNEMNAPVEAAQIAAEIQKWGRLAALARRVWQIAERDFRAWRSAFFVTQMDPADKPDGWKKPSKDLVEATYRVEPRYHELQIAVEEAEEAYSATEAVVAALKAKKDALIRYASQWHADGAPTAR